MGNPKELVIFVNPKGTKKFSLRIKQNEKSIFKELSEFREGIYSVSKARKDAINLLKNLKGLRGINILKNGNDKYNLQIKNSCQCLNNCPKNLNFKTQVA